MAVGETVVDPLNGTEPTPLSMVTEAAFVELHVKVADCPLVIDVGVAVNVMVGCVAVLDTLILTEFLVTTPVVSQNCTTT